MTGALSLSTLSTIALPRGVHEARHLGLPALLLAFPLFELPPHYRRNVPFGVLRVGLVGNQPSAGNQGRYASVDVACALTAHASDIARQVPRGDHLHSTCHDPTRNPLDAVTISDGVGRPVEFAGVRQDEIEDQLLHVLDRLPADKPRPFGGPRSGRGQLPLFKQPRQPKCG